MTANEIRQKYLNFYKKRGHALIPSAPLVPENDPTTLFNSSGMQPLVPYLLGQPHPLGKRLVNSQKSFRSQDIEEVGDNRHTTFFEMLGNWSLGDYFKKEQLPWIWEFLTKELELTPQKLYVSVFEGNEAVPKDTESIKIWQEIFSEMGIEARVIDRELFTNGASVMQGRIFTYPATKNWWSRSGEPEKMPPGEPGGPDSEVFYDFGFDFKFHENSPWKERPCHPNCDCGRFLEIANSVFMQYVKKADGSLEELPQKNVDFGGGLERLAAATQNSSDIFQTDLFTPLIHTIEVLSRKKYGENKIVTKSMRIITDHIKGAVMMMADGVLPANKLQGYVLRRLIRRSLLYGRYLGFENDFSYLGKLVEPVAEIYKNPYPEVLTKVGLIKQIITDEAQRFGKSLHKGLREIEKLDRLDGVIAFKLYETFGFPWEMTEEIALERGQKVKKGEFEAEFKKHQEKSRTATVGMFKGGLADHSEKTIRLHTAHHLLLAALQKVVDPNIRQRGSHITSARLRIDFNLSRALSREEKQRIVDLVNQKIKEDVKVVRCDMERTAAEKIGAQMEFGKKYPQKVSVYFVDLKRDVDPQQATPSDYFSAEFCGGPHVERTGIIGHFKILKEEALGSGIRRIYADLD